MSKTCLIDSICIAIGQRKIDGHKWCKENGIDPEGDNHPELFFPFIFEHSWAPTLCAVQPVLREKVTQSNPLGQIRSHFEGFHAISSLMEDYDIQHAVVALHRHAVAVRFGKICDPANVPLTGKMLDLMDQAQYVILLNQIK